MKSKTLFYLILLTFFASFIPAMHAQTFSVIHNFTYSSGAGVTIRGNALYGPACGSVYQLTHSGPDWLFAYLATLDPGTCVVSGVVFGPDGHLYGAASYGSADPGMVFKLTPQVGPCRDLRCLWTVNDLHDFRYGPNGDLIWDQQGNIYGTAMNGGTYGNGAVYELTPSENGYTERVLYSFSGGADGGYPWAGVVFDNKGNLFGTTPDGGSNGYGTVFELTYVVGAGWMEHVLYSFQNASDGYAPRGGLVVDYAGNLYGTTNQGGSGGGGTVFELSPSGDTWTFKLLYSFSGGSWCGPYATLTMDGSGNLLGTTGCDGIYNQGSVFKLSNTQHGWVYTSLHDFTGNSDGGGIAGKISIDTDGTLYGTAAYGGVNDRGVVWMIKP